MTAAALSHVAVFRFTDKQGEVAEARVVCWMKCSVKFRSFNGEIVAGLTAQGSGESLPAFLMADVIHLQLPRRKPTSSWLPGICGAVFCGSAGVLCMWQTIVCTYRITRSVALNFIFLSPKHSVLKIYTRTSF